MNLLIADDDAVPRLLLGSALRRLGQDVRQAENGREALVEWQESHPALVISDSMMPDFDGRRKPVSFQRHSRAADADEFFAVSEPRPEDLSFLEDGETQPRLAVQPTI